MPDNSLLAMQQLLDVMDQLRNPDGGCPWDLQQDFASIVPHTLEEAYEVADAIAGGNREDIKDELGDLLFQVVFYARLGKEEQAFDFDQIAAGTVAKLIRRHPHVFGAKHAIDEQQVAANWEAIKQQEREEKGEDTDTSVLAHIPYGMAPLLRALKLQKKCAKVGFDWPELAPVIDKIHEEIDEVQEAIDSDALDQTAVEEEIGDLLFAVVNLSRHAKVNPEVALQKANSKFERRFRGVEQRLSEADLTPQHATLEQMEALWQQVKGNES